MTSASEARDSRTVLGVLGGSGIYDLPGFANARWEKVESPFGEPSDELLRGDLDGTELVFLPRHGRGHRIPPSEVNYRANVWAMKSIGVGWIISVSAVGSLREHIHPGEVVEEKISLSERFGLWLSFYPPKQDEYLTIVGHWLRHFGCSDEDIAAMTAAMASGGPDAVAPLVTDEMVAAFQIAGSPDECRQALGSLVEQHRLDVFAINIISPGLEANRALLADAAEFCRAVTA